MINTQLSIGNTQPQSACRNHPRHEECPEPTEEFRPSGPGTGLAICPRPMGASVAGPTIGFEKWQMGTPTDNPSFSGKFADKLVGAFGEQAITSVEDERLRHCEGYHFDGLEMPVGLDFLSSRTLSHLGPGWEYNQQDNSYELKSKDVGQRVTFDAFNKQTSVESYYIDNTYDTTRVSETIKRNQDGSMLRENPPTGL